MNITRFYRTADGDRAVGSWSDERLGALSVLLYGVPGCGDPGIGSFPASRSLSGARPDSENGVVTVAEAEYTSLLSDRKTLEEMKRLLGSS